jgi:hypothetical protein
MKQKITCPCGNGFSVDYEEEIDLDKRPEYVDEIMNGSFMNYLCPSCGKKHKPEFPIFVLWPAKNIRLEVFPELDRGEFYRRKKTPKEYAGKSGPPTETVIGYPEMADRIAVIRDGLEPLVIEALKYYMLLKADEEFPDQEIDIWYDGKGPDTIEFHIHGLRADEVAVSRVPLGVYEKTLGDYKKKPKGELFSSLRTRSYLSIQNMLRPEELK